MSIDPNERGTDEWVLARYEEQLADEPGIAEAIAALPAPITPSHRAEAWVKPTVAHAGSLRDRARVWAPGVAGTAVVGVLLLGPFDVPLTGPLIAYGIGWIGFGWWTALGRPGPRDTAVLIVRGLFTAGRAVAVGSVAAYGFLSRVARWIYGVLAIPFRRNRPAIAE